MIDSITFTEHALDQLEFRYKIRLKRELDAVALLLSVKKYRLIKQDWIRKSWVLSIRVKSQNVKLVYNPFNKIVVTALPENARI